jgi:hypothetical protein
MFLHGLSIRYYLRVELLFDLVLLSDEVCLRAFPLDFTISPDFEVFGQSGDLHLESSALIGSELFLVLCLLELAFQ